MKPQVINITPAWVNHFTSQSAAAIKGLEYISWAYKFVRTCDFKIMKRN